MIVHLYAVCWNERRMLPFFLRHYAPLVDRIIVYDDGSTDGSADYLRRFPRADVRQIHRAVPDSMVDSIRRLHDECWKESRGQADWVMLADVDEHVYHEHLREYLARCRADGVTMIPAVGYEMVAEAFPDAEARLCDVVRRGVLFRPQHKPCMFDPAAIQETNFGRGRHVADPLGRVRYPDVDEVRQLHYKYLGLEYFLERTAELRTTLLEGDAKRRFAFHWLRDREELEREFCELKRTARPIMDAMRGPCGLEGWAYRWWRPLWPLHRRYWHQWRYLRAVRRASMSTGL